MRNGINLKGEEALSWCHEKNRRGNRASVDRDGNRFYLFSGRDGVSAGVEQGSPGYNRYFFIADISRDKNDVHDVCLLCGHSVFLCRRNTGNRRGESTG